MYTIRYTKQICLKKNVNSFHILKQKVYTKEEGWPIHLYILKSELN